MSVASFVHAWNTPGLTTAERVVFLWVSESYSAFAPPFRMDAARFDRIAQWAGLTVGEVERAFAALVEAGHIEPAREDLFADGYRIPGFDE